MGVNKKVTLLQALGLDGDEVLKDRICDKALPVLVREHDRLIECIRTCIEKASDDKETLEACNKLMHVAEKLAKALRILYKSTDLKDVNRKPIAKSGCARDIDILIYVFSTMRVTLDRQRRGGASEFLIETSKQIEEYGVLYEHLSSLDIIISYLEPLVTAK
jgi:hypothetical protein